MQVKNIGSYIAESADEVNENDIMQDIRYINRSCSLITESLQKGCDVMQLPNGDIIVTEMKAVTFQYSWDGKRGKLVRSQFGGKIRKTKPRKVSSKFETETTDIEEFA